MPGTKIKLAEDVQALTTFRNNSAEMLRKLKRNKRSIFLTVNGKPEAALVSIAEYDRLRELEEAADEEKSYQRALADIEAGRTRPAEEVFREFRKKYGIRR